MLPFIYTNYLFKILYIFTTTLFLILFYGCNESGNALSKIKPNIIYIMADDHAQQAISAYGHPLSQIAPTPNIDRLANEGALFLNNFCTNSLCGPSRAVVLTGKFSHVNGFRMNGERFDNNQPNFAKLLQQNGYSTGIVGKWHIGGAPQGFDSWDIINDQGNYYNPEFIRPSTSREKKYDTFIEQGYATDIITDKALKFLKGHQSDKKPFMLMVHHKAPHRNWMPPLRYANLYDDVEFPVPDTYLRSFENQQAAQEQLQTIYKDMYEGHDLRMSKEYGSTELAHNPWTNDFDRMTPEQKAAWDAAYLEKNNAFHRANLIGKELAVWKYQRFMQEYLATVHAVDEGVGKILDYLDENHLTENTVVIYTTDQGFYLGENGWFDKRFMYETSLEMPMLMRYPKEIISGSKVSALTQNLDFAPTFLSYAGIEIPLDYQGKSLRPLVAGNYGDHQEDFRDAIYYHYYDFPAFHMVKRHYGVRTSRYKLMHFYDDNEQWELYDLENDPKELHNLYDDPEYNTIQEGLHIRLEDLQKEYGVTNKEFEKTPREKVIKAYENFEKLRGKTGTSYDPISNSEIKL